VLKRVIFSLQVGFTGDFDTETVFLAVETLTALFSLTTKFCSVFLGYWLQNLMRIPKMCLKQ